MSALRTQLLATATAFHDAHANHDSSALAALCTPECKHRVGPSSLPSPERTTAEYVAVTEGAWKMFGNYKTEIRETLVDEVEKAVVIRIRTTSEDKKESEYVMTMRMSDDGKAIKDVYNFVDSKIVVEGMAKMGIQG